MGKSRALRVPAIKWQKAHQLKAQFEQRGIYLSLYQCLMEVEHRERASEKQLGDPFKRFRI